MINRHPFYQKWLDSTYYHEEVDFWTKETRPITNQELMDRPADLLIIDFLLESVVY